MGNIKTILAGLSLTMAVGMPAVASDELTMVVGTYTDQSTSDGSKRLRVYTLPFIVKVLTFAP